MIISLYFTNPYAGEYKEKVLRKIINLILPGSDFLHKQGIFSKDFTDSQLFDIGGKELDYRSEDMIIWNHNNFSYKISEVDAKVFETKNKLPCSKLRGIPNGIVRFAVLRFVMKWVRSLFSGYLPSSIIKEILRFYTLVYLVLVS